MNMHSIETPHATRSSPNAATTVHAVGRATIRYGLALVLLWIGAMKFTAYEAAGIEPFVANSPLMSWLYGTLSVQGVSNLLGVVEIGTAGLILLRPISPLAAAIGGGLATGTFLTTLTFLVSTPGWEPSLGGFPALSALPGQFLVKDVVLLGASLQVLGEALASLERAAQPSGGAGRR
jgi:uncharacterized membrane protein YkgB